MSGPGWRGQDTGWGDHHTASGWWCTRHKVKGDLLPFKIRRKQSRRETAHRSRERKVVPCSRRVSITQLQGEVNVFFPGLKIG